MNFSLQDIALIGSLQLVTPSKHGCMKGKNKEAWFNFVKSQNHSGMIYFYFYDFYFVNPVCFLTLSLPESNLESINVVVLLSLWMKPQCVTIQIKAIEQYFQVVLFAFDNFELSTLGSERVKPFLCDVQDYFQREGHFEIIIYKGRKTPKRY